VEDCNRVNEWIAFIPFLDRIQPGFSGVFFLWLALGAAPRLRRQNESRGIPEEVTKATLRDIALFDDLEKYGTQHYRVSENKNIRMFQNKFPAGWDNDRVQQLLAHHESQDEEEALAEDEAAFASSSQTFMKILNELVPTVRKLVAKYHH
jgi:hypothetical protein